MANLFITLVSSIKLLNGKHKVRIAVSHNLATRYIPTNIIIDAENEFKNGKVVKRPDKDILNARLKKIYDMYYERCMNIEYANTLTSTQLIKYCIFAESRKYGHNSNYFGLTIVRGWFPSPYI